ncbi:NAD-dependent epimerase/dehydratase family protein [Enterococcus sp. DIV0213h]|uniref:NAD-dependent epimerase/dehydratase family protein n=1 Tax=Enterococcus sp. DIV0213h TaxID=2774669 RepID=UPI003F29203E
MKNILITGENSYVGNSFKNWMKRFSANYKIDCISLKTNDWKHISLSSYDIVIHLAGLVHNRNATETEYFKVNRDLTIEIANKAKVDGVKQFIFFSSMSIFGVDSGVIVPSTKPMPVTPYGKSKLEAEESILNMSTKTFKIAIVRPPMIYGRNSPGNYGKISNFSKKTVIFPEIENYRSMIFIDNLICFLKIIIDNQMSGIFHPQNKCYVQTSEMVYQIAKVNKHKVFFTTKLNIGIQFLSKKVSMFNKIFGTLVYDNNMRGFPNTVVDGILMNYDENSFVDTIEISEGVINENNY